MAVEEQIQVMAPCSMEAGFKFIATYNDKSFPVTVPPGGVKEGQLFSVSTEEWSATEVTPFFVNNHTAAVGQWKDGLFSWSQLGHLSCWNAVCCPQILAAQVLTRLKMNWLGDRAPDEEWKQTFVRILGIVCAYWLLTTWLAPPMWQVEHGVVVRVLPTATPLWQRIVYNCILWVFGVYTVLVLTKLRRMIRLRYEIPVTYPFLGEYEDCCLSIWCGCCAVAQMARQTCDYDKQPAACCSPTGLKASPHHVLAV